MAMPFPCRLVDYFIQREKPNFESFRFFPPKLQFLNLQVSHQVSHQPGLLFLKIFSFWQLARSKAICALCQINVPSLSWQLRQLSSIFIPHPHTTIFALSPLVSRGLILLWCCGVLCGVILLDCGVLFFFSKVSLLPFFS